MVYYQSIIRQNPGLWQNGSRIERGAWESLVGAGDTTSPFRCLCPAFFEAIGKQGPKICYSTWKASIYSAEEKQLATMNPEKLNAKLNEIVKDLYDQRIGVKEAVLVYVIDNDDIDPLTQPFLELSKEELQHFIAANIYWAKVTKEYLGWQGYDGIRNIVHESLDGNIIVILPCDLHTLLVVIAKKVPSIMPGYLNREIDRTVKKIKAALNDYEPEPTGSTPEDYPPQPPSRNQASKEYPHEQHLKRSTRRQ